MTTAAANLYQHRAVSAPFSAAQKRRKARKSSGFLAISTYGYCIKDGVLIDPAMGSGHILVYAFEVLSEIYEAQGYPRGEIAKLIINNNIFGLELDDRAYQLACFSLSMQARRYDPKFFEKLRNKELKIHLASIQETNSFTNEMIATLAGESAGKNYDFTKEFIDQYHNAKTYGSLIKIKMKDASFIEDRLSLINEELDNFNADIIKKLNDIVPTLVKQNNILSSTYDILVMNPPYMGSKEMNHNLKNFVRKYYPDSKADLFACFMELDHLQKDKSLFAAITMHSWMFLSSFENLRNKTLSRKTIDTMAHLGTRAFEQIAGEVVQTTAFILRNHKLKDINGKYIRLVDYKNSEIKRRKLHEASIKETNDVYEIKQSNFNFIPGHPIVYWAPKSLVDIFENEASIGDLLDVKQGLATADNNRFLRLWWEVDIKDITFNAESTQDAVKKNVYWVPYNKGGKRRQWYGNYDYVVNWRNDGCEIKNNVDENGKLRSRPQNISYYFKEAITWGLITSGGFSIRYREPGSIHDVSGMSAFSNDKKLLLYILGITSTKVADYIFKMLNPTVNLPAGDFEKLPIVTDKEKYPTIEKLVLDSIDLAKQDWDSFETAWDFQVNPLLAQNTSNLAKAYELYKEETNARFEKLKANEEKLNKIVIPMYGLENQLSPSLENEDITFASIHDNEIPESFKNNDYALTKEDVVKNFISYAIGCIFGRYSLDEEGLVYTGGDFDLNKYKTYKPVGDNILFLSPDFDQEGDLLDKFIEFVEVALGSENLDDNLNFIAEALGKKRNQGDKEAIKHYLLNKFYKDHAKKYSVSGSGKRPIYWQFASTNRQNSAFNALIYMHRYDKYTLSRIRTDYLHKTQERLDNMYREYTNIAQTSDSKTDIKRAKKKLRDLDKSRPELKEYDEKLHHLADQQIELDLNDGFKQNYPKFEGVVKEV